MTVQNNNKWAPFVTLGLKEIDEIILSYLDRREIERLTSEESPLFKAPAVQKLFQKFIKEDQACIREGFPKELVDIFKKHNLSLYRIPRIEVGKGAIFGQLTEVQKKSIICIKEQDQPPALRVCMRGYIHSAEGHNIYATNIITIFMKRDKPGENNHCLMRGFSRVDNCSRAYENHSFSCGENKADPFVILDKLLSGDGYGQTKSYYLSPNEVPQVEQRIPSEQANPISSTPRS